MPETWEYEREKRILQDYLDGNDNGHWPPKPFEYRRLPEPEKPSFFGQKSFYIWLGVSFVLVVLAASIDSIIGPSPYTRARSTFMTTGALIFCGLLLLGVAYEFFNETMRNYEDARQSYDEFRAMAAKAEGEHEQRSREEVEAKNKRKVEEEASRSKQQSEAAALELVAERYREFETERLWDEFFLAKADAFLRHAWFDHLDARRFSDSSGPLTAGFADKFKSELPAYLARLNIPEARRDRFKSAFRHLHNLGEPLSAIRHLLPPVEICKTCPDINEFFGFSWRTRFYSRRESKAERIRFELEALSEQLQQPSLISLSITPDGSKFLESNAYWSVRKEF